MKNENKGPTVVLVLSTSKEQECESTAEVAVEDRRGGEEVERCLCFNLLADVSCLVLGGREGGGKGGACSEHFLLVVLRPLFCLCLIIFARGPRRQEG